MSLLELQSVGKKFSGVQALEDVSFLVEKKSITGLIGPNGAGKTTLFQCITGQLVPDQGTILFNKVPLIGKSPEQIAQSGIRRTFQHQRLFPTLTVRENILVGLHNSYENDFFRKFSKKSPSSLNKKNKTEILNEALQIVGLEKYADDRATSLSYGQQRKVEIARALVGSPELLLLDEPAAGLHEGETDELRDLLIILQKKGITILIVEHDMRLMMTISNQLIVLNFGKKIAEGIPEVIQKHPEVLTAYLGTS